MFIKDKSFRVSFSAYAQRHYCKDFLKNYKPKKWAETHKTILESLERSYRLQGTNLVDNLRYSVEEDAGIFKLDFRVAGTNESSKSSGNRVIFYLSNRTDTIVILLVYSKGHCGKSMHETAWVYAQIKGNFPEYKGLLPST